MIIVDKNQTLQPPEGQLDSVSPEGAYLRVVYLQPFWDNPLRHGTRVTTIYLQDMGREVLRTIYERLDPSEPEIQSRPRPVRRRYRIWNGFLLALQGVKEMFSGE